MIAMVMFVWGATHLLPDADRPPTTRCEIYVVGKQWMWKFQHLEGQREINELHVPVGRPVKLTMTSEDVIHSFYVPAFRIKMDAVPGRYTELWFEATKPGTYHLFCAEYCGTKHSGMIGKVVVMEPADVPGVAGRRRDARVAGRSAASGSSPISPASPAIATDGTGRGPSLAGHRSASPSSCADGRSVDGRRGYLRESILNPQAKVVAGYQPICRLPGAGQRGAT